MSAPRLQSLVGARHGDPVSRYYSDDSCHCLVVDMPPPKRRKMASPVACCDPACLHLTHKPCYDNDCRNTINYACPDVCPEIACPDSACNDAPCTDNACTDSACIEADVCHDNCETTTACPDPCVDSCTVSMACTHYCHPSHSDPCQPTCDLTACSDPCVEYDCHAFTGLFDQHPCHYWPTEPCFDLSSLSSASPYGTTFSATPSAPAEDTLLDSFGQQSYNPLSAPTYPLQPPVTHAPQTTASMVQPEPIPNPARSEYETAPATGGHTCHWAGCTLGPFASTEALHDHVKAAHSSKTPGGFVCMWAGCEASSSDVSPAGPYSAATKNHFHRHMQRHTGYAPHKCPTCERCFKTPQQLNNHLKTHTGEKHFKCAYCTKSFALLDPLRIHERVHKAEKRFQCPICGDRGADSSNMSAHKRDIHGANGIPCPEPDCKHRDSRAERLKQHMRESNHQVWRLDDGATFTEYCRLHRGSGKRKSKQARDAPTSRAGSDLTTPGETAAPAAVRASGVEIGIPGTDDLLSGDAVNALFHAADTLQNSVR